MTQASDTVEGLISTTLFFRFFDILNSFDLP